jgi:serine/threonine protein kinase
MEYVDGATLSNLRVERESRVFEAGDLEAMMAQLCDAISYAHNSARIVHRDLKPANLMINTRSLLSGYKSQSSNWLGLLVFSGLESDSVSSSWIGTFSNGFTLKTCKIL